MNPEQKSPYNAIQEHDSKLKKITAFEREIELGRLEVLPSKIQVFLFEVDSDEKMGIAEKREIFNKLLRLIMDAISEIALYTQRLLAQSFSQSHNILEQHAFVQMNSSSKMIAKDALLAQFNIISLELKSLM